MSGSPEAIGLEHQDLLRGARRIVVKVGSSLVTNEGRGLDEAAIGEWCRQLAALAAELELDMATALIRGRRPRIAGPLPRAAAPPPAAP